MSLAECFRSLYSERCAFFDWWKQVFFCRLTNTKCAQNNTETLAAKTLTETLTKIVANKTIDSIVRNNWNQNHKHELNIVMLSSARTQLIQLRRIGNISQSIVFFRMLTSIISIGLLEYVCHQFRTDTQTFRHSNTST